MTTQPEARLFRLKREESVLARNGPAQDGKGQDGKGITHGGIDDTAAGAAVAGAGSDTGPDAGHDAVRIKVLHGTRNRPDGGHAASPPAADAGHESGDYADLLAPDEDDDGFAGMRFPGAAPQDAGSDADALRAEVARVRTERLSPRQLRVANRVAASHGIAAASDEEAVALLRRQGIDPFGRAALRRAVAEEGQRASRAPGTNVPSLIPEEGPGQVAPRRAIPLPGLRGEPGLPGPARATPNLPSREQMTEERRAAEIFLIQRDIARRRRRRVMMLLARLAVFVLLPTVVAGWYYFTQATPLYATESSFQIQKAESAGSGALGSLFAGTQLATNPDSVAVQNFLGSREAMQRLDREIGFKSAFQDPSIDRLTRLPPTATDEDAYKLYRKLVKVSYDPTEGMIGLEVIAPRPDLSQRYSLALIHYAEDQVDQMTARLRDDQMLGATNSYHDAEAKVEQAQRRIQDLQQRLGVLDPAAEGSAAMAQIAQLEQELTKKQLELGQLQANAHPNASRVQGVQGDISRLRQMIAERRGELTESSSAKASLATITGELRIAEGDLLTRQQLLAAAAAQMETARIEANKQVRYLSLAVAPVAPDSPTYPKALQNTIIAFLIFAGIYLMLSLTASVLREQVSS